MVCPICIVDGIAIASCRLFGIPDAVTMFFVGIFTMSFAYWTNYKLNTSSKWRKQRFQLSMIVVTYACITLIAMQYLDMW